MDITPAVQLGRIPGRTGGGLVPVQQGFRILRASYWNTFLFPLMLLHRLIKRSDAQSDVHDYPRWLDTLFSMTLVIERSLIAKGLNFPFGGSLLIVATRAN